MGTTTVIPLLGRAYRLFIPTGVAPNAPLVIYHHSGLGNAEQAENETGLDAVSEAHTTPFVIAYPYGTGINIDGIGDVDVWNLGTQKADGTVIGGHRIGLSWLVGADDVSFVRDMLAHILLNQSVDPTKVYVAGHSNGGEMTYSMISIYPEKFAGATCISTGMMIDRSDCAASIPLHINHVHGTADLIIPLAGGNSNLFSLGRSGLYPFAETKQFLEDRGASYTTYILEGVPHAYVSVSAALQASIGMTCAELIATMV